MAWHQAFLLGLIEGITEFLPVSSTAHIILLYHFLGLSSEEVSTFFLVFIQFAAILAVLVKYYHRLRNDGRLLLYLSISFFPFGVLAFAVKQLFESYKDNLFLIIGALFLGGVVMLLVEYLIKNQKLRLSSKKISSKDAFLIGLFQTLALVPGVSRSAAVILGMLFLGYKREEAVEYSFLLALPTITVATIYQLVNKGLLIGIKPLFTPSLILASVTAFFSALLVMRAFLRFVSTRSFTIFGFYRVFIAILLLILLL